MKDSFYEQFVSAGPSALYKAVKICMKFCIALGIIYLLFTPFLGVFAIISCVLAAVTYFLLSFLKRKIYVDYEYIFTNGEIDIVSIGDKIKRKLAVNFSMSEVELLAPKDSDAAREFSGRVQKVIICYPKQADGQVYSLFANIKGLKTQIDFIPDKELVDLCFHKNPRVVKKSNMIG